MNETLLDMITQVASINLYSISKQTKTIELINFNPKDENHLGLFYIAAMCSKLYQFKLRVQTSFWTYLLMKFKYRKFVVLDRIKNNSHNRPSCDDFIRHISDANKVQDAFKELYNRYYKGEIK